PDALARLWLRTPPHSIELAPLTLAGTEDAARAALAGPVDRRLALELLSRSGGNPLALREVIRIGLRADVIRAVRGVWHLLGDLPPADPVATLLSERLSALDPSERRIAELTALGDPLDVMTALRIVSARELEQAEISGVIVIDRAQNGTMAPGPGLWRDAVIGGILPLRRHRLVGELADAIESSENITDQDRLRAAGWRLDRGDPLSADRLIELAGLARAVMPGRAERFLRAAVAAGGGMPASLGLLRLLVREDRAAEARAMLDALAEGTRGARHHPDVDHELLAIEARLLAASTHRPHEAIELLDRSALRRRASPELSATRTLALWRIGRVGEAMRLGEELVSDPATPVSTALDAGAIGAYAAIYAGDRTRLSSIRQRIQEIASRTVTDLPDGPATLTLIDAAAAHMKGMSLEDATRTARAGYDAALHRGEDGIRAQFAVEWGWTSVLRGRVYGGLDLLREAYAARGAWTESSLPWVRSLLTRALVLAGEQHEAETVAADLASWPRPPIYDADAGLAEAMVWAGRAQLARAARRARDTASAAEALGQGYLAFVAWYDALRYGDVSCAHELLRVAGRAENDADEAVVRHARGVVGLDPDAVQDAAAELAVQGRLWFAVDAQAQAVAIHRRAGRIAASGRADARLATMLADGSGLDSPIVRALRNPVLTPREHAVAQRAAAGMSDAELAQEFGLSVRTVQTHLTRIYRKLDVDGRRALATVLRPDLN
ncbi:LuxR C-terminal-related transcriptional regulator, partial [Microbacterium sp.]|uniref:helix-turn-helix transcriptional regulator n=1 Tax=Microbacterium sp. TaxID=51671 RepID=UPI003C156A2B